MNRLAAGTATEEQLLVLQQKLRSAHALWVSFYGDAGEEYFAQGIGSIAYDQLPRRIERIFVSSLNPHKHEFSMEPLDGWFELQFDFRDSPILDWQNPVSAPTSNESYVLANGDRTWTGAIIKCAEDHLSHSKNHRVLLHRSFVYDALLLLVGLPATFLALYRLQPLVKQISGDGISVLSTAINVYLFFLCLRIFRVILSYTKWVFPAMELQPGNKRRNPHRAILAVVLTAVIGEIIHSASIAVGKSVGLNPHPATAQH